VLPAMFPVWPAVSPPLGRSQANPEFQL
jgi:hypothetical protein